MYRFLKIANITSTNAFVVQNQHGLCPNIGCYIISIKDFPCMLNSFNFHFSLSAITLSN